jgi:formylglycine-generating enzyme required for sulfatase activity
MNRQRRRDFLRASAAAAAAVTWIKLPDLTAIHAQDNQTSNPNPAAYQVKPDNIIPAPSEPGRWPEFREALHNWRRSTRQDLKYDDLFYRRDEFAWVPGCFCCCFLMMYDESFYDHSSGRYVVESFLDRAVEQFGGFDGIVLWHAYPRIGLDHRNQFDFYRDMPGGLEGLKKAAEIFHSRGVKVFIDYNPWDTGTDREDKSDLDMLADFVKAIDADGIFLDTMNRGSSEFRARLDAARKGVVLESEGALPLENIHDHHMSWAQWFRDSVVPGILRNKWLERRHMQHQIDRCNRDHTAELHTAWMNGSGMMVWENVFGTWVGWNAHNRSILRAMLPIQRRYVKLFSSEAWTPLVQTEQPDIYAGLWETDDVRLWTLINRSERTVEGTLLHVEPVKEARYYDLIQGQEISSALQNGLVALKGRILPRAIGAFVCGTRAALGSDFTMFLAGMRKLCSYNDSGTEFPARKARLSTIVTTEKYERPTEGMVEIPPVTFDMNVVFRVRECGFYESQNDHLKGAGSHPLHHLIEFKRQASLCRYAIDVAPVTNSQYEEFLRDAGYMPRDRRNFLKHWIDNAPAPGQQDHPVVYVDLDDARAYAAWAGKRLPTEDEWQYAAQGPQGLLYPWGNEFQPDRCNDGRTHGTTPVRAFAAGRSPFGCYDMCGNVWHWTESERSDGRTRFCIIKGGSYYKAEGSGWYMDGGPQPCNFAAKMLLMWPGLDRCATIGFRCVVDLTPG